MEEVGLTKKKKHKKTERYSKIEKGRADFFSSPYIVYSLLAIILLSSLYLRLHHLNADPPLNLSWSLGPFTDEGHVTINARNKLFFGEWRLDDFFRMGISALVTFLTYLIFKIFGYGFAQARCIPILFSLLTLFFLYLVIKKEKMTKYAILSVIFLGSNFVYLMHNRLALEETDMLFFVILSIYFWQLGKEKELFYIFAGLSLGIATFFVKILGLFFIPILILDFIRLKWSFLFKNFKLSKLKPLYYVALGFGLVLLGWIALIFLPFKSDVLNYIVANTLKSPAGKPETVFAFVKNFLNLGVSDRLFPRMPLLFILSFSFLLFWFRNLREKLKSSNSIEFISILWLFLGMLFLSSTNYHPVRYQMILIPPLCMLAGFSMGNLSEIRFFKTDKKLPVFTLIIWWAILLVFSYSLIYMLLVYVLTHYQSFVPFISAFTSDVEGWLNRLSQLIRNYPALVLRSIILASIMLFLLYLTRSLPTFKRGIKINRAFALFPFFVLILLFLMIQLDQYNAWASNVRYDLYNISRDLRSLPTGSVIAGPWTGAVCLENNHRAIVMQAFANKDRVLERFGVTHLIIFKGGWEDGFFRENYPEIMKKATLLKQYPVRNNLLLLYKI
jgi:4-amino-4-deoxy-L-arabinose transferase-like glycosyltransferase